MFDQRRDLALLARIDGTGQRLAAFGTDAVHQRQQRIGAAAADAGHMALARKAARDRVAGGVAGAHHPHGLGGRRGWIVHADAVWYEPASLCRCSREAGSR